MTTSPWASGMHALGVSVIADASAPACWPVAGCSVSHLDPSQPSNLGDTTECYRQLGCLSDTTECYRQLLLDALAAMGDDEREAYECDGEAQSHESEAGFTFLLAAEGESASGCYARYDGALPEEGGAEAPEGVGAGAAMHAQRPRASVIAAAFEILQGSDAGNADAEAAAGLCQQQHSQQQPGGPKALEQQQQQQQQQPCGPEALEQLSLSLAQIRARLSCLQSRLQAPPT